MRMNLLSRGRLVPTRPAAVTAQFMHRHYDGITVISPRPGDAAGYLAALPDHPAPADFIPMFLALNGKEMGVEHAMLFQARDLQAPLGLLTEDTVADS